MYERMGIKDSNWLMIHSFSSLNQLSLSPKALLDLRRSSSWSWRLDSSCLCLILCSLLTFLLIYPLMSPLQNFSISLVSLQRDVHFSLKVQLFSQIWLMCAWNCPADEQKPLLRLASMVARSIGSLMISKQLSAPSSCGSTGCRKGQEFLFFFSCARMQIHCANWSSPPMSRMPRLFFAGSSYRYLSTFFITTRLLRPSISSVFSIPPEARDCEMRDTFSRSICRWETSSCPSLMAELVRDFFVGLLSWRAKRLGRKCWMMRYCSQVSVRSTGEILPKCDVSIAGAKPDQPFMLFIHVGAFEGLLLMFIDVYSRFYR